MFPLILETINRALALATKIIPSDKLRESRFAVNANKIIAENEVKITRAKLRELKKQARFLKKYDLDAAELMQYLKGDTTQAPILRKMTE
jgi:cell fate (sporulation/competence/biofilm development) regulator YmcA (YheA/YmcA/DUF963 family)